MRSVSDQEVLNKCDDLEMIRRRHLWPMPMLPLKNPAVLARDFMDDSGLGLLESDGTFWRVYIANAYEAMMGCKIDDQTAKEYDSPEAVLADGWVVD